MKAKFSSLLDKARKGQRGQVLVLFVVISAVIFGAAVIAIDLGTYVWQRQRLETAVDAAALAGGQELPESGSAARTVALQYVSLNDPDVDPADVSTTFRCLVGDRDENGSPDPSDIPAVCNPGVGVTWACADKLCISQCTFSGTNSCNVLVVEASKDVPLNFTRVLGLPPIVITASRNGACKGFCGTAPTAPLDVIIVIDRSPSMSSDELSDAKDGALATLEYFDANYQHVGLAVLGAASTSNHCVEQSPSSGGTWLVVPLSDDYQNADGSLNTSSSLVSTINCIGNSSATQSTDLGSPLSDSYYSRPDALSELLSSGRADATMGIIFLTDGEAREPGSNPCSYAYDRATVVKGNDIEIYTIGYGVQGLTCGFDSSGTYKNVRVTELLADMATDSADDQGHCATTTAIAAENADGDHFMCQAKGEDLESVFVTAANALAPGVRLIGSP